MGKGRTVLAMCLSIIWLTSCAPSAARVQTAIAQTAIAQPQTIKPVFTPPTIPTYQPQTLDLGISVEDYKSAVAQYGWTDWKQDSSGDWESVNSIVVLNLSGNDRMTALGARININDYSQATTPYLLYALEALPDGKPLADFLEGELSVGILSGQNVSQEIGKYTIYLEPGENGFGFQVLPLQSGYKIP